MEQIEVKTPLLKPKKFKKLKKAAEDCWVEEFKSFGSSNYFNIHDDDEINLQDSGLKSSMQTERNIENWLLAHDIFKSHATETKEGYFEEKRERVNSISFCDFNANTGSTDISPNNQSSDFTPPSLQLTPINSKICRKRSNFSSMAMINLESKSTKKVQRRTPCYSRFNPMNIRQVESDQKVKATKEMAGDLVRFAVSTVQVNNSPRRHSDL
jgi:hypothetical protein